MQRDVLNAVNVLQNKYNQWQLKTGIGIEQGAYDVPLPPNFGWYDDKGTWNVGVKPKVKKTGGTQKKEKEEELNLLKIELENLKKLGEQLDANLGLVGAELELKRKILEVQERINFLNTGFDIDKFGNLIERLEPRRIELPDENIMRLRNTGNVNPRSREMSPEEEAELMSEAANRITDAFSQSLSFVQQIDQLLGGGAAAIINAFQTAFGLIQSIIALTNAIGSIFDLFSIIPGVGIIGRIIGGASGGGRAYGGDVFTSRPYMVGERGKEMFIPDTSGIIIPNHLLSQMPMNDLTYHRADGGYISAAEISARNSKYMNSPLGSPQPANITIELSGEYSESAFIDKLVSVTPGMELKIVKKNK
jgi:hypothetical protein